MSLVRELGAFLKEAQRRSFLLFCTAALLGIIFLIFIAALGICGNPPLADICHWLKPLKFSLSLAIYTLTVCWFVEYIRPSAGERKVRLICLSFAALTILQIEILLFQGLQYSEIFASLPLTKHARATISMTLSLMADAAIIANMCVVLYIASFFFRPMPVLSKVYLWCIRCGFIVFFSSCFLGIFLLARYGAGPPNHVSYGFPFSEPASLKSNLLSLHFVGIHALQFLPLVGFYAKENLAYAGCVALISTYLGAMVICMALAVAA